MFHLKKITTWHRVLILGLIAIAPYIHTINYPFLWDDETLIVENTLIRSLSNTKEIFTTAAFGQSFSRDSFYRPLQIYSYALNYAAHDLSPAGYRLVNILFHTINAILIFFLLKQLGFSVMLSWWLSVIFAIHPLHIESVTYISGRGDAMVLTAALLCFLLFLKEKPATYVLSIACYIASLLIKENGVSMPLIILSFVLLIKNKISSLIFASLLSIICLSFLGWRIIPNPDKLYTTLSLIADASLFERLCTIPYIITTYLKLWFFPYPLHMEYHYVAPGLLTPYLFILGGIIFIIVKATKIIKRKKLAYFGLFWMLLALGPVLQIVALPSTLREHWFYLPCVGLVIWLGTVIESISLEEKHRKILFNCFLMYLVIIAFITIERNKDWRSSYALYSHDVQYEPKSFLLQNNLGVYYFLNGNLPLAKDHFIKSIKVSPKQEYGVAYNNLGAVYEQEGNQEKANKLYQRSIDASAYFKGYINLASNSINNGKHQQAIPLLLDGLKKHPNNSGMNYLLALAYGLDFQFKKSNEFIKKVLYMQPDHPRAKIILNRNNEILKEGFKRIDDRPD